MRGLWIDEGEVLYRTDLEEPPSASGEVRVQVTCAGVCATDLALQRGYMSFRGVPGHEFLGVALDGPLAGRRVVGDINASCGACATCRAGRRTHCPHRTVLGIAGRPGAFAERLSLPAANLYPVPDEVADVEAVFAEPLAAALEIPEQLGRVAGERVLVVGDGRLGLLCAAVLSRAGAEVTVAGRHPERCDLLPPGVPIVERLAEAGSEVVPDAPWDVVVEASGNPAALGRALELVRPRGRVVLKTTAERPGTIDLAALVVHELQLIGSRCGPLPHALDELARKGLDLARFVADRFPLEEGPRALARAGESGVLKVLIDVCPE